MSKAFYLTAYRDTTREGVAADDLRDVFNNMGIKTYASSDEGFEDTPSLGDGRDVVAVKITVEEIEAGGTEVGL